MDERRIDETAGRPSGGTGPGEADERGRGLYIISVAAELVGVHPQTLRIYERKGLLSPSRTAGNTRRYSERDISRLQTIQRLTQEGINLAGVKMIVDMENELDRMRGRMREMREEIDRAEQRFRQEVERVRRQYRGDIVPASDMDRLRRQLRVPRRADERGAGGQEGRPRGRRAIPLGPVEERRGPIAAGPGG